MAKSPSPTDAVTPNRIYGRRKGRSLSAATGQIFEKLLDRLQISAAQIQSPGNLDPKALFCAPGPVWLEVGFGNGAHLVAQMAANPSINFIGAEPFLNGMAAFLKDIQDKPQTRIRVWMEDAAALTKAFTSASIDRVYILNPDPWPKARHHKRRFVQTESITEIARVLTPGGLLIMSTDIDDLAAWMVTKAAQNEHLEWAASSAQDWQTPPPGWIKTKYEKKGEGAGRRQTYLVFRKK